MIYETTGDPDLAEDGGESGDEAAVEFLMKRAE